MMCEKNSRRGDGREVGVRKIAQRKRPPGNSGGLSFKGE